MKIVIEIDDVTYDYAKNYNKVNVLGLNMIRKVMTAIANGKVLQKNREDEETI